MATMYDLYLQVFAYSIIIFGSMFILNFLTKGFIIIYLRVKASRGRKVLVRVYTSIGKYYAVGSVKDDVLNYKKRNSKDKSHVDLDKADVQDEMGIKVIEIEEITGKVINKDFEAVDSHNIEKFDGILIRALQKPNLMDKTKETITLILLIVAVIGIGVACFMLYNQGELLRTGGTAISRGVI